MDRCLKIGMCAKTLANAHGSSNVIVMSMSNKCNNNNYISLYLFSS